MSNKEVCLGGFQTLRLYLKLIWKHFGMTLIDDKSSFSGLDVP